MTAPTPEPGSLAQAVETRTFNFGGLQFNLWHVGQTAAVVQHCRLGEPGWVPLQECAALSSVYGCAGRVEKPSPVTEVCPGVERMVSVRSNTQSFAREG